MVILKIQHIRENSSYSLGVFASEHGSRELGKRKPVLFPDSASILISAGSAFESFTALDSAILESALGLSPLQIHQLNFPLLPPLFLFFIFSSSGSLNLHLPVSPMDIGILHHF